MFCFTLLVLSSQLSAATEPPRRIISLAPNITEILFALDLGDRIVGVTGVCDFPEAARRKPKVGGMSDPSLEAVVSLKPDLVVMTTDGNTPEFEARLRSLHIRTYVFRARKLSELPKGIDDLGLALGVKGKAHILSREIESSLKSSHLRAHPRPKKKVLFIIWPEPLIVAGPGTAIDDAITLLGHDNIASRSTASYPKYSLEEVINNPPDIIFIGKGHSDMKARSKDLLKKLAIVPAVSNGKVFFLSDSLYRLGPRVVQGIAEIAACLE